MEGAFRMAIKSERIVALNLELETAIERFARALCCLFTIGPLGSEGRRYSGILTAFLNLRDNNLGTTDYRKSAWKGPYG